MNQADLDALFAEADALEERGERRKAFRLFLRGALHGCMYCAMRLGSCYAAGRGTRRDPAEALRWDRIARRRGAPAYNLAVEYANQNNWRLARKWWERSVAEGDKSAGIDLALCLLEGRGARRDPRRAHRLLTAVVRMRPPINVSQAEHEEAMALLGILMARGIGTRKSLARARRWLARANADGDYPQAGRALDDLEAAEPLDVVRSAPWRRRGQR